MDIPRVKTPRGYLFKGQLQHLLLLLVLLALTISLARPALDGDTWLGVSESAWFYALLGVCVLHQVVGWLVFRAQLVYGLLTRLFRRYDLLVWGLVFVLLFILRMLFTLAVGLADAGSLGDWRGVQAILGVLLLIPTVYTVWSVGKYFGMLRALGGDHFREKYRRMPLVREGIFKYSNNAIYAYAFLALWAFAMLCGSRVALAGAFFQHTYIWVHMWFTEAPDMALLYGDGAD